MHRLATGQVMSLITTQDSWCDRKGRKKFEIYDDKLLKVAVTLIFVLIPTVPRTSTTYLLLGKITSKIYVSQFFVPVQYFPLTNFLPWCKASNF